MPSAWIFTFVFILSCFGNAYAAIIRDYVLCNSTKVVVEKIDHQPILFCYEPQRQTKSLFKTWSSVKFYVNNTKDFSIYVGDNESHIQSQYEQTSKSWFQLFPYWTQKIILLSPHNRSCVGVVSSEIFEANLVVEAFNKYMFTCFLVGNVLFLLAPKLSRNVLFHYGSGIMFGVLTSLLILAFILGRLVPKRNFFYTILVAGISMSAYMWNFLYDNLLHAIETYHYYFVIYAVISGIVSFSFCYYKGPITNPRLVTIIQWVIQIFAIFLMYVSSQITEAVIVSIVLLLLLRQLRLGLPYPRIFGRVWYKIFPPKIQLLTEEEFHQQGIVETERALHELRKFCQSPDCSAWKTVSRLQSPTRFSRWVEGHSGHLIPDEISFHEKSFQEYYEDEDDDEYDDGGGDVYEKYNGHVRH